MLYTQVLEGRGSQSVCRLSVLSGSIRANCVSQGATLPQTQLLTIEIKAEKKPLCCLQQPPPTETTAQRAQDCVSPQHWPSLTWSEETQRWSDSTICCPPPLPDRAGSRQNPTHGRLGNAKGLKGVRTYLGELGCGQITRLAAGQQVKLTSSVQAMCLEQV